MKDLKAVYQALIDEKTLVHYNSKTETDLDGCYAHAFSQPKSWSIKEEKPEPKIYRLYRSWYIDSSDYLGYIDSNHKRYDHFGKKILENELLKEIKI